MMYAVSGTRIFIGSALDLGASLANEADFESQVWKEILNLESLGRIGAQVTVESQLLPNRDAPDGMARPEKYKTTIDEGAMQVVCAADTLDDGQLRCIAALTNPSPFAFRIILTDKGQGGGVASRRLFTALVSGADEVIDTANSVHKLILSLEITSNVVRVEPIGPGGGGGS